MGKVHIKPKHFLIAMSVATLPFFSLSSCTNQNVSPEEKNDNFVGFRDNQITYKNYDQEKPSYVNIVKKSEYVYTNTTPIDIFTSFQKFDLNFEILVKNPTITTRLKAFLDPTTSIHGLSLVGGSTEEYLDNMPEIIASNPQIQYDTIYVNFECNESVFLMINFRIWIGMNTGPVFSYTKTSPDDKKTIWKESGTNSYFAYLECPSNTFGKDFREDFDIICRAGYYQKINYDFITEYGYKAQPKTDSEFISAFSVTVIPEKKITPTGEIYLIHISYCFSGSTTPTRKEATKNHYYLGKISCYQHQTSEILTICNFELIWI